MPSKYKDLSGAARFRTMSLFKETIQAPTKVRYNYVFTLSTEDKDVPSLHRLFVEMEDPTEYEFAIEHLGSWPHWLALKQCEWFKPHYEQMRNELEIRLRSKAIKILADIANAGTPASAQAAKWLAEGTWNKEQTKRKGRPSKDDISNELKRLAKAESEVNEDAMRLGMNVVPTSKPN